MIGILLIILILCIIFALDKNNKGRAKVAKIILIVFGVLLLIGIGTCGFLILTY